MGGEMRKNRVERGGERWGRIEWRGGGRRDEEEQSGVGGGEMRKNRVERGGGGREMREKRGQSVGGGEMRKNRVEREGEGEREGERGQRKGKEQRRKKERGRKEKRRKRGGRRGERTEGELDKDRVTSLSVSQLHIYTNYFFSQIHQQTSQLSIQKGGGKALNALTLSFKQTTSTRQTTNANEAVYKQLKTKLGTESQPATVTALN